MNETKRNFEEERFSASVHSPLGPVLVVVRGHAVVGLYHQHHEPPPKPLLLGETVTIPARPGQHPVLHENHEQHDQGNVLVRCPERTTALLRRAALQLEEYFEGTRQVFDLPVVLEGTPFQLRVWSALAGIPYGERRSYRDIAAELGNPSMGRAVGAAVRANPLSIIVPGHRVVSRAGGVIGYAAGSAAKETLLELESGETPSHAGHGSGEVVVTQTTSPG